MGRNCLHAQDNVGQCGVGHDHTRQDTSENGCLQNWGGQICGCAAKGYAPALPVLTVCDGPDWGTDGVDQVCGSVDSSTYDNALVCYLSVMTGGDNCAGYCASKGRVCLVAMDNVNHDNGGGSLTRSPPPSVPTHLSYDCARRCGHTRKFKLRPNLGRNRRQAV